VDLPGIFAKRNCQTDAAFLCDIRWRHTEAVEHETIRLKQGREPQMISRTDYFRVAQEHLLQSALIKQHTARECMDSIVTAAEQIAAAFRKGGKVLLCGNGLSASTRISCD